MAGSEEQEVGLHRFSDPVSSTVAEADVDDEAHARRFIESFVLVETSAKPWGEPPDSDTRHAPAFRYLFRALRQVEQGSLSKKSDCAALLRQYRLWRDNLNPRQDDFVQLQAFAKQRLMAMAGIWEQDVYRAQQLGIHLGGLAAADDDDQQRRPRQDHYFPLPRLDWVANESREEWVLIVQLVLLAHAVDPLFQASVERCVHPQGAHRTPGVKNARRMRNKLYGDYREDLAQGHAEIPLSCQNVDLNRCACTFETHADLKDAFSQLQTDVGPALRVKNTFAPTFDAEKRSFGYRCILMNILFSPTMRDLRHLDGDAGRPQAATDQKADADEDAETRDLTWGDLIDRADTQQRWGAWLEKQESGYEELYHKAVACIKDIRDVRVQWVSETQLLLRPYLDMRKRSHLWYKILRADKPRALCYDFLDSYKRPTAAVPSGHQFVAGTTNPVALEEDVMEEGVELAVGPSFSA